MKNQKLVRVDQIPIEEVFVHQEIPTILNTRPYIYSESHKLGNLEGMESRVGASAHPQNLTQVLDTFLTDAHRILEPTIQKYAPIARKFVRGLMSPPQNNLNNLNPPDLFQIMRRLTSDHCIPLPGNIQTTLMQQTQLEQESNQTLEMEQRTITMPYGEMHIMKIYNTSTGV